MPRGDGTGPQGMGSMTGRSAGFCAGYDSPGYANPVPGRGFGMGGGRGRRGRGRAFNGGGRGWRNWFHATGLPGWMRFGGNFGGNVAPVETPAFDPIPIADMEKQALQTQANSLQSQLDSIRKRLDAIEEKAPSE